MSAAPIDQEELRLRLRGRRAGLIIMLVLALSFVAASSVQITSAVFGLGIVPLAAGPDDSPERRCALGIRRLLRGLDEERAPLDARWPDAAGVEQACQQAKQGIDAWAALLRLRDAQHQLAQGNPELTRLRGEVAEHLPPDLR